MLKLKTLRLLLTFYLSFFNATFIITLVCAFLFLRLGLGALQILICFKIITLGLVVMYINDYKRKDFFYYQNLGISKSFLWTYTLTFDFILFILLLILAISIK